MRRAENAALQSQLEATKGERDSWRRMAEVNEKVAGVWQGIAERSGRITTIEDERVADCRLQLSKADAEISRLRNPGFFREIFDAKKLFAGAVGFGLGRATK